MYTCVYYTRFCLHAVIKKQRAGDNLSPLLTPPLTPQTNAARVLARIGDEVRATYEFQLEDALYQLFTSDQGSFSYEFFRDVAIQIVDGSLPGWRQVKKTSYTCIKEVCRKKYSNHRLGGNIILFILVYLNAA